MAKKKGIELIKLKPIQIINNNGQLEGLPKNPRLIKDDNFKALKKSISECKIMTEVREVVVYPHNENYIVIAGNMRFKAMEDLKFKAIPCKVIPKGTPIEVLREIAIKDNSHSGEYDWDIMANEWNTEELSSWDIETPNNWIDGNVECINEVSELNKEFNFTIKCDNLDELEKLQSKLNTSAQKINFNDFILKTAL